MWLAILVVLTASPMKDLSEALAQEQAADAGRALRSLDLLVTQNPSWELPRIEAGRLRMKLGQELDRAEADLDAARSIVPENPRAQYLWGLLMDERGRRREAIRALEVAVLYRPDYADARFRLAGAYFSAEDWGRAEAQYRALSKLRPDWVQVRLQLAAALEKENRVADAEAELKRLLAEQPQSPVVRHKLAELYTRTHRSELASELLEPPRKKMRELNRSKR